MGLAALAGGLAADVGAGAAVAAPEAVGALGAADVGAGLAAVDTSALTAAAIDPTLTASIAGTGQAGLDAATAQFGAFSPDLFAANTADVAAGGVGTDLAAAGGITGEAAGAVPGTTLAGTEATGTLADTSGFFGGGNLGTSFTGQPFGDAFATPGGAGGQVGSDIGTFGGGTTPAAPAGGNWASAFPGVGENTGGAGFGAADQTSGPIVSSEGIVDTGGGLPSGAGGASLGNTINVPSAVTPASQNVAGGLTGGSIQAGGVQDIATQFGDLSSTATTPASFSESFATNPIAGDFSALQAMTPSNPEFANLAGSQLATMQQVGIPPQYTGDFTGSLGNVPPSDTAVQTAYAPLAAQPLPPPTTVAAAPGSVPATPTTTNPIATAATPATVPSSPAAVANAPAAATGGIDPLTGLRMGAAGASIIASGINIANALNQPSYTALQPQSYPGSPFNPQPNAPGFPANNQVGGGIAGGLAANRLANGLLNGASPRQLALSGLISPERATRLQGTYSGITQAYARQLGVSAQSLSPGVKWIIAARALADSGLGGR